MVATVARRGLHYRVAFWRVSLRKTRQGVEFTENADHGLALAVAGDESCRFARDTCVHAKPRLFKVALQQK